MNKIIFAALVLIFTLTKFYSQEDITIEVGKKYKFVLFDDTQVIGKVIALDEKFVKVQTNKGVITVSRENILYISTDLTPEKYDFSLSLTCGVSFLNREYYYYYSSNNSLPGPHFNAGAMFYISDSKAVKVDLSLSFAKPKFENTYYIYYEEQPPEQDKFEGGEIVYFSLKPSFALGGFKPSDHVTAYASLGLGINYFSQKDVKRTYYYYNYEDSTYTLRSETRPGRNDVGAVLGLGGGINFRITPKLSILTEGELNVLFSRNDAHTYIPL